MAATKEQRQAEIILNGTQVNSTLKQLTQAASVLHAQLSNLPKGTKEFTDKAKELAEVRDNIARVNAEVRSYQQEQGKANSLMGKMGQVAQQASAYVMGMFAVSEVTTFAQNIDSAARSMIELRREVQLLTGATGEDLDKLSTQVKALSDTFNLDFNEVIKSGNVLSKEFGTSFSDSLKIVETSLLNVSAVQRDEILSQMNEYSVQAKQAGLTIDQFAGVLIKSSNMGVFSDKGIDTIKEFGLRIREQTKATGDALTGAFGAQFTQKLFTDLNKGSITTVQALEKVAGKLQSTGITAKQAQTVIADVFGGPGEDAGLPFIQSLANVTKGTAEATKETAKFSAEKKATLTLNQQLASAQNDLAKEYQDFAKGVDTASKTLQVWLYQGVVTSIRSIKEFILYLYENRTALFALVTAFVAYNASVISATISTVANTATTKVSNALHIAGAFAVGAYTAVLQLLTNATVRQNAVQLILNALMKANPIGLVIAGIGLLIGAITYLSGSFSTFNGTLKLFGDIFKGVFNIAVAIIKPFYGVMVSVFEGIGGLFQKLYAVARFVFYPIFYLVEQLGDKFSPIMNILRVLYKAFETTFGDIGKVLKSIISLDIQGFFTNFSNYLVNIGKNATAVFSQVAREIYRLFDAGAVAEAEAKEKQRAELQKFQDQTKERIRKGEEDRAKAQKEKLERQKKEAEDEKKLREQKAQAESEAQKQAYQEALKRQEEYNRKVLQARQNLEDAKNSLIQDQYDREIAQNNTEINRKIEAVKKEGVLVNQQIDVLELQRSQKTAEINAKRLENTLKAQEEEHKKTIEQATAFIEQETNVALASAENAYLRKVEQANRLFEEGQIKEAERLALIDEARFEREQADFQAEQMRLQALLGVQIMAHNAESIEAQRIANQILDIEQKKNDAILKHQEQTNEQKIANEKRTKELKKQLQDQELQAVTGFFEAGIALLSLDEASRKRHAEAIKAFTIANIAVNLASEIQGIWKNANLNPTNVLVPGWGTAFAAVQTGIAIARAAKSTADVINTKFEDGGLLSGPSHARGGIRGTGRFANVEVEGGEFINNKISTANNLPALRMINAHPNTVFDVVPRTRFEGGGQLGSSALPTALPAQANDITAMMMQKFDILIKITVQNTEAIRQIKLTMPLLDLQKELAELDTRQTETTSKA